MGGVLSKVFDRRSLVQQENCCKNCQKVQKMQDVSAKIVKKCKRCRKLFLQVLSKSTNYAGHVDNHYMLLHEKSPLFVNDILAGMTWQASVTDKKDIFLALFFVHQ